MTNDHVHPIFQDALAAVSPKANEPLRFLGHASEMKAGDRWCTCCKKELSGKVAWLELDQRNDTYHDFGGVPSEKSQGWFPFGITCAKKMIAQHRARTP